VKADLKKLASIGLASGLLFSASAEAETLNQAPANYLAHSCGGKNGCSASGSGSSSGYDQGQAYQRSGCASRNSGQSCSHRSSCSNRGQNYGHSCSSNSSGGHSCSSKGGNSGHSCSSNGGGSNQNYNNIPYYNPNNNTNPNGDPLALGDSTQATAAKPVTNETELMSQLNPQGKTAYLSLSPEGKKLALQLAQQSCKGKNSCKGLNSCKTDSNQCAGKGGCKGQTPGPFKDKNTAVKVAAQKMAEKREGALQPK